MAEARILGFKAGKSGHKAGVRDRHLNCRGWFVTVKSSEAYRRSARQHPAARKLLGEVASSACLL